MFSDNYSFTSPEFVRWKNRRKDIEPGTIFEALVYLDNRRLIARAPDGKICVIKNQRAMGLHENQRYLLRINRTNESGTIYFTEAVDRLLYQTESSSDTPAGSTDPEKLDTTL